MTYIVSMWTLNLTHSHVVANQESKSIPVVCSACLERISKVLSDCKEKISQLVCLCYVLISVHLLHRI